MRDDTTDPRTVTVDEGTANAATIPAGSARPREVGALPTVDPAEYTVLGEIARGGMGRIRAAIDRRLGRHVAIKELLKPDRRLVARFEREALVTARLQHPSIVSVYEAGRWPNGEPFYAMKLVSGRSLKQVIAEATTHEARLALLPHVLAVADAIAYAHDLRIIHRDLKPSNVLVGSFGETVVLDWGLVKDLDAGDEDVLELAARGSAGDLTQVGSVIGTPNYMPPEQANGEQVDERADVYALGALLYHLLAGEAPYRGDSSAEVIAKLASGPPAPLASAAPDAPLDLVAIVERAMAREPAGRYPTARELVADLRSFTTGRLVSAHRYTRRELVRRFARRFRVHLVAGALSVVAIAVIGAVAVDRVVDERDTASAERAAARTRADELLVLRAAELVERDPHEALALLRELSPGSPSLAAARVIASDAHARRIGRALRGHTDAILDIAPSADGRWIASAGADRTVRVWDLASHEGRIIGTHDAPVTGVSISDRGELLASASRDGTIRIWDARGALVRTFALRAAHGVRLVSTRHAIGFSRELGPHVWDLASGALIATLPEGARVAMRDPSTAVVLADADQGSDVSLLDLATGTSTALRTLPCERCTLEVNGRAIAWVGDDKRVSVWDVATGELRTVGEAVSRLCPLSFTADARYVAGACGALATIWTPSGTQQLQLRGHEMTGAPQFSADGTLVLGAGFGTSDPPNKHSLLVDRTTGQLRRLTVPDGTRAWLLTPDDRHVIAAAGSLIWVWPARDPSRLLTSYGREITREQMLKMVDRQDFVVREERPAQITVLADRRVLVLGSRGDVRFDGVVAPYHLGTRVGRAAIAPDRRSLATLGEDGTVRIIDLASGTARPLAGRVKAERRERPPHPDASGDEDYFDPRLNRRKARADRERHDQHAYVTWSPDGTALAAAEPAGGRIHRWDTRTGAHRAIDLGSADSEDLGFLPGGALAVARSDGSIAILDGDTRHDLAAFREPIEDLDVSATGVLVAGGLARSIFVWQGGRVSWLPTPAAVTRLAITADGRTIAAAFEDRTVALLDVATGARRQLLALGHPVTHFAFSDDGTSLAIAGGDGAELCDVASARCRELYDFPVNDVAMFPSSTAVAGALSGGRVIVWPDMLPRGEPALRAWLVDPVSARN